MLKEMPKFVDNSKRGGKESEEKGSKGKKGRAPAAAARNFLLCGGWP
jgi:hypothetical protein